MVHQNRRGLGLLTTEKGDLSLFLEKACCFYQLSHHVVKETARNLTNRSLRTCQHLSNSWENWPNSWNWIPCIIPFLGLLLLLALILAFGPCLMRLFSKFLQDPLQAFTNRTIHELLLTHSDYQKLWPHTNPLDPHSSLFLSYPHNATVPQEVTEDWPLALILNQKGWNDRAHMGVSLIRWLIMSTFQTKNKPININGEIQNPRNLAENSKLLHLPPLPELSISLQCTFTWLLLRIP